MTRKTCSNVAAAVAFVLLVGCSVDPQKGKQQYLDSGLRLMKQEKYPEAAAQFQNALRLDPKSVDALYDLAQAHMATRYWAGAYAALRKAIDLDPARIDARLTLGSLLLTAREYKLAGEQADAVLKRDPGNASGLGLRALSLAARGDTEGARAAFLKVIELQPRNASAYAGIGMLELVKQQYDAAEQWLRKAIAIDPRYETSYNDLSVLYRLRRQPAKAEAVMRDAVRSNPDSIPLCLALAGLMFTEGRTAEIDAIFGGLEARRPKSAAAPVAIGDFYLERGDRARAAEAYRRGIKADGRSLEPRQRMVDWYIAGGQLKEAERLNAEILRQNPRNLAAGIARARLLLAQKHVDEAIAELKDRVHEPSDSWQRHYFLGAAYGAKGVVRQAREQLEMALRLSPDNLLVQRHLGYICLDMGDVSRAQEVAETAVKLRPDSETRLLLGTVLLRKGELAAAREQLMKATQSSPANANAQLTLGLVNSAERRYPEAESAFEAALAARPRFDAAMTALTEMLVQRGENDRAFASVEKYLAANPGDATAYLLRGSLQARAKRFAAARSDLFRALELDPDLWQANMRLAEVYRDLGETDAAIAEYERALKKRPRLAAVHGIVARLYHEDGNMAAARKHYEQALAIDPGLPAVANNLAFLYTTQGGDLNVALSLAQQAKQQLPDSPEISDTLGWVLYHKGLYSSAIPILQECAERNPASATYKYHLGMALLAAGEKQQARVQLEAALGHNLGGADGRAARAALARIH